MILEPNFETKATADQRERSLDVATIINEYIEGNPSAPLIGWDQLYGLLGTTEIRLLDEIRSLTPAHFGLSHEEQKHSDEVPVRDLVEIKQDYVGADGIERHPRPKFIPEKVLKHFVSMKDEFSRYCVENNFSRPGLIALSGYRSPAYQAMVILREMGVNGGDLGLSLKSIYLPGYSEHNDPEHTAIDITNIGDLEGKVNRSKGPQSFEDTIEFSWLLNNAHLFGFTLTLFPDPNNPSGDLTSDGFAYEPWHWRFVDITSAKKEMQLTREVILKRLTP